MWQIIWQIYFFVKKQAINDFEILGAAVAQC
jgi:hypothetical protein